MKILIVSCAYPSENNIRVMWLKNITEFIRNEGHKVDLLVIKKHQHILFRKIISYLRLYINILITNLNNYDCVYVHLVELCMPPFIMKSKGKSKFIANLHGKEINPPHKHFWLKIFAKISVAFAVKKADLIVVPTYYYKNEAIKNLSINEDNIFVYPSGGVNLNIFRPAEKFNRKNIVLGSVGHLTPGKRNDVAIRALARLDQCIQFIIIGDGPERVNLEKLTIELGIEDKVSFTGLIQPHKIVEYLHSFTLFLFTSTRESLGLVGLEALACGVPVIGSNIPPFREYIINGVNGYLFEPGNDEDLARKIMLFLSLPEEERINMSNAARKMAMKYEGKKATCELLEALSRLSLLS